MLLSPTPFAQQGQQRADGCKSSQADVGAKNGSRCHCCKVFHVSSGSPSRHRHSPNTPTETSPASLACGELHSAHHTAEPHCKYICTHMPHGLFSCTPPQSLSPLSGLSPFTHSGQNWQMVVLPQDSTSSTGLALPLLLVFPLCLLHFRCLLHCLEPPLTQGCLHLPVPQGEAARRG